MTSRNSDSTNMPDKQTTAASPRLHQLVRVGPDGRPEIVGRIGITKNNDFTSLHPINTIKKNQTYITTLIIFLLVADDEIDVIEGNGFLNMAMHTLVQDSQGHNVNLPNTENRPATATAGQGITRILQYFNI